MIKSYCSRCKQESTGENCQICGKHAAANAQQDVWSIDVVPLSDGRIWRGILLTLLGVAVLLFVLIFGLEAVFAGNAGMASLGEGRIPQMILLLVPVGLLLSFAALSLQGRETHVYVLDKNGAHLQTWHAPGRLKSWARLQSYDSQRNFPMEDGGALHLAQEWHLLWKDVEKIDPQPAKACILLYQNSRLAPMVLRLPPDEFELAIYWVQRHCKGK